MKYEVPRTSQSEVWFDLHLVNKLEIAAIKKTLVQIYERHAPEIFRFSYRILDDRELAEECVADTFLRLLIAVRGRLAVENIRVYLFRTAYNWILDHCHNHPPVPMNLKENLSADAERNFSHPAAQDLDRQRMRHALLQLPAEQRQVIELAFMENCSHLEVAKVLGKTVEATRVLQKQATEALCQILAESKLVGPFL
jgi:RNA polymerase sigma-70 factor (ECF subfamily)